MNNFLVQSAFHRFMGKMILTNLMVFLSSIISSVAISRCLGTEAMSAFQLTLPLFFLIMMFSQIISMGVQNNCAKSIGAGRGEEASSCYSVALLCFLPLALLLALAVYGCAAPLALFLTAGDPVLAALAADYLRGEAPGLAILLFLPMQISILFLDGRAKVAMRSVYVQTAVNIAGVAINLCFAQGGLLGMGLVLTACNGAALLFMLEDFWRKPGCVRFSCRELKLRHLLGVLRVGLPSAVDRFYKCVQLFVVNRVLLAVAPGTAIAAFADINALNNVFNPIVMGISATTLTMAGVFSGERDAESLRKLLGVSVKNALLVLTATAALACLFAPQLVSLFVAEDGEAAAVAIHALRIFVWYLPLYAVNNALQKYYLGINAMQMTYLTSLLDNLVFICLLSMGLGCLLGAEGVWLAFIAAEALTALTLLLLLAAKQRKLPRGVQDLLCLPQDFTVAPAFSRSASDMQGIVEISEAARSFMLRAGATRREAYLSALAIEEMGGNIIRWGFIDGKPHSIDILIIKGEKEWRMRLRDDCRPFDPNEWLKLHRDADKAKNIGIRLICGMAREVRYTRTLGLNYLLVHLQ